MRTEFRESKVEVGRTYTVDGKHQVLGMFEDTTQKGTFGAYIVVWKHIDTDAVVVSKVDEFGYTFGQGKLLKEVRFYNEYE